MNRRFFLTTLFKGVVASTVAYSLPIVGKEYSEVIPSPLTAGDILDLELDKMRYAVTELFAKNDAFYYGISGPGKFYKIGNVPMVKMKLRPGGYFK